MEGSLCRGGARVRRLGTAVGAVVTVLVLTGLWAGAAGAAVQGTSTTVDDPVIQKDGSTNVTLEITGTTTSEATPTDLILVLDESGSQSSAQFAQTKQFARDVVTSLGNRDFFANGGRVGIVMFASSGRTVLNLNGAQTTVLNAINSIGQSAGLTCIGCGLDLATQQFNDLSAAGRNRVAIVLTDGANNVGDLPASVAASNAAQVERFVVGVGAQLNQVDLRLVASDPDDEHLFLAAQFADLEAQVAGIVGAVDKPGATNVIVTPQVSSAFAVSAPSASKGAISQSGNQLIWTIPELGAETATLTYTITHDPAAGCDVKAVHDSIGYTDDQSSGATFDLGSVDVTGCNQPPDCSSVAADPSDLGAPNHKLRTVTLAGATDPDGDPLELTVTGVTQDEPVNGKGDGDTGPDALLGPSSDQVQLRAERSAMGDGRVYRIAYTVSDGQGGECSGTALVGVRRDRSGAPAVDSAPASHDSLTG